MADRQLTERLADQPVEVASAGDVGQVARVVALQFGEVLAVVIRVVEEVAHEPPGLAIHLLPFGGAIDLDLQRLQVEP